MEGQLVNQYMSEKAGMTSVDKKSIAETIERLTAGSPKSLHEKQMQEKRSLEVVEMLRKILAFSIEQKDAMKKEWWKQIYDMKNSRELGRYWAHFDFDMFYIACELLEKPEFKEKPCAVGGNNSVLCTANYQARKYGLRAAMPTFIAKELCPQVLLFEPNFTKYKHFSNIFKQILSAYDPEIQSHGLDEAYVDLTIHLKGKSRQEIQLFIKQIRTKIFQSTGLTVSCGVGANKMLAKMASEEKKPNDQFILENQAAKIEAFMLDKKLRKIPGIGPVNEYYLKGLGIESGKDILQNLDVLTICFSKLSTEFFVAAALGIGSIEHEFKQRKSVGKSQTFRTTEDIKFLQERLNSLCEEVSMQLQQLGFMSINVVFTFQTHNFQKRDKTFNLLKYTDKATQLFEPLLNHLRGLKSKVRLLGVKCSSLIKTQDFKKQQLINYINNPKKAKQELEEQKNSAAHIKNMMRSDVVEKGKFLCPICNDYVQCKGNIAMFNKHVDRCLNMGETASVAKSSKTQNNEIKTKKSKGQNSIKSFFKKQQK